MIGSVSAHHAPFSEGVTFSVLPLANVRAAAVSAQKYSCPAFSVVPSDIYPEFAPLGDGAPVNVNVT